MLSLSEMYRPITSEPFSDLEIEPCSALKPYVRCFWGTPDPAEGFIENSGDGIPDGGILGEISGRTSVGLSGVSAEKLIIPDTCMDIIFYHDPAENRIGSIFCAIDDRSYRTGAGSLSPSVSVFGIRFYAWTAALFAEDTLSGSKNGRFPAEAFFSGIKKELDPVIASERTILSRKAAAERVLLKHMRAQYADSGLMNAVYTMLDSGGSAKITDICGYACVSERKLERLFGDVMGVSPKTFSSLVRYQLVWQDTLRGANVLDTVEKYGYSDQSHLLNDFKKRHLMYPKEAVNLAKKRYINV